MKNNPSTHVTQEKKYRNGKIPAYLDETDRAVIKEFCKVKVNPFNLYPLRSVIDLTHNDCTIYFEQNGKQFFVGKVKKEVFKKTYELLVPFKLYVNREPVPGEKPKSYIVPASTIVHTSEDFNSFYVPVPAKEPEFPGDIDYVKIPRFVLSKIIRQVRSLMLVNEPEGIGTDDGMQKIDLVQLTQTFNNALCISQGGRKSAVATK